MQLEPPDISVIIPALNERECLEFLIPSLKDVIACLGLAFEIIVVDGGSHDGTAEASERLGARVVSQEERGYGGALISGFTSARAPYIITMDADFPRRPIFVEDFWRERDQAEVLIASRYTSGGKAQMGFIRGLLSRILNGMYIIVLSLPFRDVSSGFRMYRRHVLAGIDLQERDFNILEELIVKIYSQGRRIKEVPFDFKARVAGRSHAKIIKLAWAHLKTILRMRRLMRGLDKRSDTKQIT